jgi:hypothetical protein
MKLIFGASFACRKPKNVTNNCTLFLKYLRNKAQKNQWIHFLLLICSVACALIMLSPSMLFDEQSQVFSASVNLATETAIVRPVSEAKIVPNWQKQLGEALAKHLTSCGFISNLRGKPSHHHHCCCCDYTPPSSWNVKRTIEYVYFALFVHFMIGNN